MAGLCRHQTMMSLRGMSTTLSAHGDAFSSARRTASCCGHGSGRGPNFPQSFVIVQRSYTLASLIYALCGNLL